jgi:Uma2 family endonuclease
MVKMVAPPPILPTTSEPLLTGEEALALGDIGRFELIDGRIVKLSPVGRPHARVGVRCSEILGPFVRTHRLGEVYVGEIGIWIRRKPDTARAADLAFVSTERLKGLNPEGYLNVAPDLVIEIMSPEDRWSEVKRKLRDYFSIEVRLVWVIDTETRTVTAYRSLTDVREYTEEETLTAEDILPGFALAVKELLD